MKIVLDVNWDSDARVWYAVARDEIGLVTENGSLDGLRKRILEILPDLLAVADLNSVDVELVVHGVTGSAHPVAAE